jgi:hypothetical protein
MRVVLYVPAGLEPLATIAALVEQCDRRGWCAVSYTRSWRELVRLLADGHRDLGVVATRAHLPPARLPRLVVLDEEPPDPQRPRWRR